MPSRILCPKCETAFAYSPALLGKTVQCRQCAHRFTVDRPPADAVPAGMAPVAATAKAPTPPPLPARVVKEPPAPPVARRQTSRGGHDDEPEPDEDRPRRRRPRRERTGTSGALVGLLLTFLLGFAVLAGGLGYMLWPSKSKGPGAGGPGPTPPAESPLADEPPKRLEDILRDAPQRAGGAPAVPNFDRAPIRPPGAVNPVRPGGQPGAGINPPVFPPALAPERPLGVGPKFAALNPLPIKPARMAGDRSEVTLPGPVESLTPAGGGRYLLLHVPAAEKVVVFDASEARIAKQIDVPDAAAKVAGGMNLFVIYQPGRNVAERWSLDKLQREAEVKSAFPATVKALGMGCASNGPLVAALGGDRSVRPHGGATLAYFDPATLRELAYEAEAADRANPFGLGFHDAGAAVRVSADGSTATGWGIDRHAGSECHVFAGHRVTKYWEHLSPQVMLPSADGRLLYSAGRSVYGRDLKAPAADGFPDRSIRQLPAVQGNWYATVRGPEFPFGDNRAASISLFRVGQNAAEVTFDAVNELDLSRNERPIDQSVALVPAARVLVTVAAPNRSKLVLRRVEPK